jgi:hypothetical protein
VRKLAPIQAYDRARLASALDTCPSRAVARRLAKRCASRVRTSIAPACSASTCSSVTDGDNTSGRSPDDVAPRDLA